MELNTDIRKNNTTKGSLVKRNKKGASDNYDCALFVR